MKKIKKIILLILITITFTGCDLNQNDMKDINIYTTTYPINYLITSLYQDYSKIYSIYPIGVNLEEYTISKRKLEEYSQCDLFIFNSLDKDRDYAVKMINLNSKLKVIDVSTSMKYNNSIEELWLNPNNYLMMAENIKNGLAEYSNNPYLTNEVEEKYKKLEYEISKLDASLTEMIMNANYNTIIVDNDVFKFLESRNLKVISLEENDNLSTNTIEEVNKLIKENKIKYIYTTSDKPNKTIESIVENNQIELLNLNTMHSIDGNIKNSNDNYLTIMTNNIKQLEKELYKQ